MGHRSETKSRGQEREERLSWRGSSERECDEEAGWVKDALLGSAGETMRTCLSLGLAGATLVGCAFGAIASEPAKWDPAHTNQLFLVRISEEVHPPNPATRENRGSAEPKQKE